MFLALGVAGLILLTGTDLSVGRMVGMGMVTATIIMHNGINTGAVFGMYLTSPLCLPQRKHCLHC
jgi:monosaccharide ABC transporter membrane protein, CUT2 family (TC 3.A.1.2.-)